MRLAPILAALGAFTCQQTGLPQVAAPADPLRAIHDALYASFLPVDEVRQDPQLSRMFAAADDGLWSAAGQAPAFRELLKPFADLRAFGAACGIADYLKGASSSAFSGLPPAQRQHVLFLLQSCSQNEPRRLAANVRNFYVVKAYGAVQEALTGVKINLYAGKDFVDQQRPELPPSRLRYDRAKKQIVSTSGPIDYLIVGSGPAGSVLAHELRRGGKRVLLVDRGSLIVPGSMQTRMIDGLLDSRTSADGGIIIHNGMVVGGGTQVNVDLCFAPTLPAIQEHIEIWRKAGQIGQNDFTFDELDTAYRWVRSAIGTRTLSGSEMTSKNQ